MNNQPRRAEVQRKLVIAQIQEINWTITQIQDAMTVSEQCESPVVVMGRPAAMRAIRNLQDLEKRFLVGMI